MPLAVLARGADRPPNIIHIVGDDIGYDDVGPFGARDIPTMNLDRLAQQGMKRMLRALAARARDDIGDSATGQDGRHRRPGGRALAPEQTP